MRTQPNLAIKVAAAALALSACGGAVGISAGTAAAAPAVASARHAPGDTGFAELREIAQVKRDVVWRVGHQPVPSPDGGLAGCATVSGADEIDYPQLSALFSGSRWPDLRNSGLAWVEIVTKQRSMHAYGGETVWFYQRLSAACAKHGHPLTS